jgi:hypothetical protein
MAAMHRQMQREGAAMTINRMEVLDPRSGAVIATAELPDELALMSAGLASSVREESDGTFRHDIWRLVLRPRW